MWLFVLSDDFQYGSVSSNWMIVQFCAISSSSTIIGSSSVSQFPFLSWIVLTFHFLSVVRSLIILKAALLLSLVKLFSISEHLFFIQSTLASRIDFLTVLLQLRYSEVKCDSFICFFSLRRSSHSANIAYVIHVFLAFP